MEFRHAVVERGARTCCATRASRGAWPRPTSSDPKPEELSWEPVGYLRLRKTEYGDDELEEWAGRIRPALDAGADIFCYFKHEDDGASPKMAKRLEDLLDRNA